MVVIVGAGAMGGWLASEFVRGGYNVNLLDVSEPLVTTIREQGLTVEDLTETRSIKVNAVTNCEGLGYADVVFFFVKAQHTESAAHLARPVIGPQTTVVSLQNGWGNADVLANAYPESPIVVGVTYHSARVTGLAKVAHTSAGDTFIGPYLNDESMGHANIVSSMLTKGEITHHLTEKVITEVWKKLVLNSATLPVAALTRLCTGELGKPSDILDVVDELIRETVMVAQAQGYDIDLEERIQTIHRDLSRGGNGKASMLQDAEAMRKTEIEVVNGAVVKAAEALGLEVPMNRAMVGLIHGLERGWRQ